MYVCYVAARGKRAVNARQGNADGQEDGRENKEEGGGGPDEDEEAPFIPLEALLACPKGDSPAGSLPPGCAATPAARPLLPCGPSSRPFVVIGGTREKTREQRKKKRNKKKVQRPPFPCGRPPPSPRPVRLQRPSPDPFPIPSLPSRPLPSGLPVSVRRFAAGAG